MSNPEGTPEVPEEQTVEKKTVSYESYQKLLGEKKNTQKALEEMNQRLSQYEQEKLESEGKVKELNENLKSQLAKSKEEKKALAQTVQDKVIRAQFLRNAEKLGCVDSDLAFKSIDLSDIDVNDDLELDNEKLVLKLTDLTKAKPYLFKKEVELPNDLTPNNKNSKAAFNPSDMSIEELTNKYKELSLKG